MMGCSGALCSSNTTADRLMLLTMTREIAARADACHSKRTLPPDGTVSLLRACMAQVSVRHVKKPAGSHCILSCSLCWQPFGLHVRHSRTVCGVISVLECLAHAPDTGVVAERQDVLLHARRQAVPGSTCDFLVAHVGRQAKLHAGERGNSTEKA